MLYADKAAEHTLSPPGLSGTECIYILSKTCLTAQTRLLWKGRSLVSAPVADLHLPAISVLVQKCTDITIVLERAFIRNTIYIQICRCILCSLIFQQNIEEYKVFTSSQTFEYESYILCHVLELRETAGCMRVVQQLHKTFQIQSKLHVTNSLMWRVHLLIYLRVNIHKLFSWSGTPCHPSPCSDKNGKGVNSTLNNM